MNSIIVICDLAINVNNVKLRSKTGFRRELFLFDRLFILKILFG